MTIVFILFVVFIIGLITFKTLRKNSLPSNTYTPYDALTMGNQDHLNSADTIQDTKHHVQYEEKTDYNDVSVND